MPPAPLARLRPWIPLLALACLAPTGCEAVGPIGGPLGPGSTGAGGLLGQAWSTLTGGSLAWQALPGPQGLLVETKRLPLSHPGSPVRDEVEPRVEAFLVPTPEGGAWLVWNQGQLVESPLAWGARWQRLDADLAPVGPSLAGPDDFIVNAVAARPGGRWAAFMERRKPGQKGPTRHPLEEWFDRWDTEQWVMRFDAQGREEGRTFILGEGEVRQPQATTGMDDQGCLLAQGEELVLFSSIGFNFATPAEPSPDVHQGDFYVRLDAQGREVPGTRKDWFSSHSSNLTMATGTGGPWLLSSCDGANFGLNLSQAEGPVRAQVWVPSGQAEARAQNGFHTTSAGRPGHLSQLGDRLWLSFQGARQVELGNWLQPLPPLLERPSLLAIDLQGQVLGHFPLDLPAAQDDWVPHLPFGPSELLVAWGSQFHSRYRPPSTPRLARFDLATQRLVGPPVSVPMPFNRLSPWATLADGSVAWAVLESPKLHEAQLVRVRPSP